MVQRSVSLSDEMDDYLADKVCSGHYSDLNELVTEALEQWRSSALEEPEVIERLRRELQKGVDSGIARDGVMEKIRAKHGWTNDTANG